ncbi:MAG: tetratricopeptide repeat protein [Flavobacteriaceae bacterium]
MFKAEAQTRQASASGIADSLYALGNYAQAINEYAKENSVNAKLQVARAYNAIGNFEKAVRQYESIINTDTKLQIARFELGKLYFKMSQFREANTLFYTLTTDDGENPEYFYYLGESNREMQEEASSLVAYKKAVALDSTHLRSLFQLGKFFVVKKEKNQALNYIDQGLRFYDNDVALINLKALALFNDYDYAGARPIFEKLLDLGEEKAHIYQKLAFCYYQLWEFEKARAAYRALLQFPDTEPEAMNGLAQTFHKEKIIDSAMVYYQKAIDAQKPFLGREYSALAQLAREQNDLKKALKYYQLALDEDPENDFAYYQNCAVGEQLHDDAKKKLACYEGFLKRFSDKKSFYRELVTKRVSQLKQEIHMGKE